MVGKLAPNSSHLTRGLVKYVPGRGYFRAVSSQNGDNFVTSPPPPIVERVLIGYKFRKNNVGVCLPIFYFVSDFKARAEPLILSSVCV